MIKSKEINDKINEIKDELDRVCTMLQDEGQFKAAESIFKEIIRLEKLQNGGK